MTVASIQTASATTTMTTTTTTSTTNKETLIKIPAGDGPYVRAKHAQLLAKDPERAIVLFWAAINAGDRVDSALKDMAIVMKQQNRAEEAIEAIRSFRRLCSAAAQAALDNLLLDLYKKCGRIEDQIDLLKHKLNLIHTGLIFNGKRTKTARSQGKKFQISIRQEATRLLGNLGWAYMQLCNYVAAEAVYRKALLLDPDNNKLCNLGMCLMKQERFGEAKVVLRGAMPPLTKSSPDANNGSRRTDFESHMKSYERAQTLLKELADLEYGSGTTTLSTSPHVLTSPTKCADATLMSPPMSPSTASVWHVSSARAVSVSHLALASTDQGSTSSSTTDSPVMSPTAKSWTSSSSSYSLPELLEDLPEFDPWSTQWKLDMWADPTNNVDSQPKHGFVPPTTSKANHRNYPTNDFTNATQFNHGMNMLIRTANNKVDDQWSKSVKAWSSMNSLTKINKDVDDSYDLISTGVIGSVMDAIDMDRNIQNNNRAVKRNLYTHGNMEENGHDHDCDCEDEVEQADEDEEDHRKILHRNYVIQQHRFRIFQQQERVTHYNYNRYN